MTSGDKKSTRQRRSENSEPQATTLVQLAVNVEKFHDGDEAYAKVVQDDHLEVLRIGSKAFETWLQKKYWERFNSVPSTQALKEAIGVLRSMAIYGAKQRTTHVRIAGDDNVVWLDLANEKHQAVRIDANGWEIVDKPEPNFVRPRGMLPLPFPVRGGSLNELRKLINVRDDYDWIMIVAWLVAAFRPRGPYPILIITGEQGSAKSTLSRMLRSLIDPNKAALRNAPKDERDLVIAAKNGQVIALDNLSKIPESLSDALCRLSTGGGFGTRQLFTDTDEILFEVQRPVILNAITEVCTRSDLLDRAVSVTQNAIPAHQRLTESELWARFNSLKGEALGVILDAVSYACSASSQVRLNTMPRMADFATWVQAAEPALPWEQGQFLLAYESKRVAANESAIESCVVASTLTSFMEHHTKWQGTATEMMDALKPVKDATDQRSDDWPKLPHIFTNRIKRIVPNLRAIGLNVEFKKTGSVRLLCISRTPEYTNRPQRPERP